MREFRTLIAQFERLAYEAHERQMVLDEFREFIRDFKYLTQKQMAESRQLLQMLDSNGNAPVRKTLRRVY